MARKQRDEGGGYSYMDTYGDMVTLLLCFFVLLFSMSTVDNEKWEIIIKAFSNEDGNTSQIVMIPAGDGSDYAPAAGEKGTMAEVGEKDSSSVTATSESEEIEDLEQLAQMIQSFLEQSQLEESVSVESQGKNAVYMTFDNNLFFDGDSYTLRQSAYDILGYLGNLFKAAEGEIFMIRINGHTAAIPGLENYEVNDWDLSSLRANRVATYFEEQTGISSKKLMTNGWGKNHPVAENDTEEGRVQNRRVDIQILGKDYASSSPEELLQILNRTLDVQLYDNTPAPTDEVVAPDNLMTDETPLQGEQPTGPDTASAAQSVPQEPEPVPANVDLKQIEDAVAALEKEAAVQ